MFNWISRFISKRIRELEEKNRELQDQVDVYIHLKKLHLDGHRWEIDISGEFIPILAEMMYMFFKEAGGKNYVEMKLNPKNDECGPLSLTLQRIYGKTPHECRVEAEKQVETLKQKVEELEKNSDAEK